MMNSILNSPLFGIGLCILTFEIGLLLYRRTLIPIFNPILISISLISLVMLGFNIDLAKFETGGKIISAFLGPATVILAVPLYNQLEVIKKNLLSIFLGIISGCFASAFSVLLLSKFFKLTDKLTFTLLPKSITTPIGMELSKQLGGFESLTVISIIVTGIFGAVFSPMVLKLFKIHDPIAKGIAIGTSSHAVGTSKALEMGEIEGAMSSLSIGIAGLLTVFIVPLVLRLF